MDLCQQHGSVCRACVLTRNKEGKKRNKKEGLKSRKKQKHLKYVVGHAAVEAFTHHLLSSPQLLTHVKNIYTEFNS